MDKPKDPQYYKFKSEEEIIRQIESSSIYERIAEYDPDNSVSFAAYGLNAKDTEKPIINLEIENGSDKITIKFDITKKNIFKSKDSNTKIDLVFGANITLKLKAALNIDIVHNIFEIGSLADIVYESQFTLKYSDSSLENLGSSKNSQKLKELEKYLFGDGELPKDMMDLNVMSIYFPTPVPGVGILVQGNLVFKLDIRAEFNIKFKHELNSSFGVKNESDGLKTFENRQFLMKIK